MVPRPALVAELDEAEPVAELLQAEGLRVDGEVGRGQVGLELLLGEVPLDDLRHDVRRPLRHLDLPRAATRRATRL